MLFTFDFTAIDQATPPFSRWVIDLADFDAVVMDDGEDGDRRIRVQRRGYDVGHIIWPASRPPCPVSYVLATLARNAAVQPLPLTYAAAGITVGFTTAEVKGI
jgi:hypothetical protein